MILDELRSALPGAVILDDPDVVAGYCADQTPFVECGRALAVVFPRTTAEVSTVMRLAHRHRVPVVPRGAGSSLAGCTVAVDGCLVLSLSRMDAILAIEPADRLAVVQPGVVNAALRAAVAEQGLFYPPDPGSYQFCTIGGNVSTNAGGMCCVKYGVTTDFVMGIEVVLADGSVIRTGRRTVKGVAGYDLTRLFVGSEGTLGVITEITLALRPAPPAAPATMVAAFDVVADAGRAVAGVVAAGITPSMLEIMDRTTIRAVDDWKHMGMGDVGAMLLAQSDSSSALAEIEAVAAVCRDAGAEDVVTTDDAAEGDLLVEARRLCVPAFERLGSWLLDDVAVPRSRLGAMIARVGEIAEAVGLTIGVFGHAGDGNLHPTIVYDRSDPDSVRRARVAFDDILAAGLSLGGTVTGEHGIGVLKRDWLEREVGPGVLAVHRAIKHALDPYAILNPGKVFEPAPPPDGG